VPRIALGQLNLTVGDLAGNVEKMAASAVEAAAAEYRRLGCETVEVSLPNMKLSVPVYYVLAPAEASSNLARYDGVRYGYRAPDYSDLTDLYKKTRAQGLRVGLNALFSVDEPIANSSMLVLPILTAPAASSRSTTWASYGETKLESIFASEK